MKGFNILPLLPEGFIGQSVTVLSGRRSLSPLRYQNRNLLPPAARRAACNFDCAHVKNRAELAR